MIREAYPYYLMQRLKAYERQTVLMHCVRRFTERADELAESLCVEVSVGRCRT